MGNEVNKLFLNIISTIQCCKTVPYRIDLNNNNELTTDNYGRKNTKKILPFPYGNEPENKFIQDNFYNNFNTSKEKVEELKESLNGKYISNNNININSQKFQQEEEEEDQQNIFYIIKIKDVYNKAKILTLKIISGNDINNENFPLEIYPLGYLGSKRKTAKDGVTYFGCEKTGISEGIEVTLPLDVTLRTNNDENIMDDKFYGRQFQIKFNPDDLNYYLKDLGHGFGTFIKIIDWLEIKNNFLLNIGENYLVFSFPDDDNNENNNNNERENYNNCNMVCLYVKVFSGNSKQNVMNFLPENCPFTIGRSNEAEIFIDDNMLSRSHCTVDFRNGKWVINDGHLLGKEGEMQRSTNGSWAYTYEDTEIVDNMIFKSNHNLFLCNLIEQK